MNLEWENNSIGNELRPLLVRLHDLSVQECTSLLADLQTSNLNDERPLWEILGLAIPLGTPWKQLRIGELKTLLALVVGDQEAILEGCDWIHHFKNLAPARRLVYRCVEAIVKLDEDDESENYTRSLALMFGAETLQLAEACSTAASASSASTPWAPTSRAAPCTRPCWPPTTSCSPPTRRSSAPSHRHGIRVRP
ncbi:hypothetical protein [Rugamonas sp. DEMB1]|uniref:hypothetical protein n=1 Tax=Rugamonas sp. DEMB1 TaxID=3039386 RepID=UPI00244B6940|nr:hypothetical protein [Rugamonas sp. DEMB1]WGG53408.1 hypothetical protein QC826_06670 [Rugamonas sp. DEMB1]